MGEETRGAGTAAAPSLRPHPLLPAYYASFEERSDFVRRLFNRTAAEYDRINHLFSLGSGGWYRRYALRRAGLRAGALVLDVAVGTGLVAREARRIAGPSGAVLGLDLSEAMLAVARRSLPIPLIQGRAEALPLADASVDFVSMGYALRHVPDLPATFREFRRVLRPGGVLLLLEIAPRGRVSLPLARLYLGRLVPLLCRALRGAEAQRLMRYYWDTIENCVAPEAILDALTASGFSSPRCETELGLFRCYTGRA